MFIILCTCLLYKAVYLLMRLRSLLTTLNGLFSEFQIIHVLGKQIIKHLFSIFFFTCKKFHPFLARSEPGKPATFFSP